MRKKTVGFGIQFTYSGTKDSVPEIVRYFSIFLGEETGTANCSIETINYITPSGRTDRSKRSIRLHARSYHRRTEVFITPKDQDFKIAEVMVSTLDEHFGAYRYYPEMFLRKAGIKDMERGGDYSVEVRIYIPTYYDIIANSYASGTILGLQEHEHICKLLLA